MPFEQIPSHKSELEKLFDDDQKDRKEELDKKDPSLFAEREKARYERAQEIYAQYEKNPQSLSAEDVLHLAFLFQHGQTPEDYHRAHVLALEAEDLGVKDLMWAKNLSALAEDRYLWSIGKPQKWGTQFIETEAGRQYATPLEDDAVSGITDEMRAERNIPTRDDQLKKISEIRKS